MSIKKNIREKSEKILTDAQLRRTKSRIDVLSILLQNGKPLTQEQIAAKAGTNGPDKVTIYRTLETLIEADLVHKAFLSARKWHFELADRCTEKQCHPHFTCTNCGNTFCMTQLSVPMAKSPHRGFKIKHQQVQLAGLCPNCT
jgi:Fur family transcriptional regulator, ferric uptake regulator